MFLAAHVQAGKGRFLKAYLLKGNIDMLQSQTTAIIVPKSIHKPQGMPLDLCRNWLKHQSKHTALDSWDNHSQQTAVANKTCIFIMLSFLVKLEHVIYQLLLYRTAEIIGSKHWNTTSESGKKFQCWIFSAFKMRLIWSFFSAKGTKGIHDRSFSSHAVIYGILSGQLMSPMIHFMWLVVLSPLQTPHFRRLTGMQYSVQGQAKLQSLALFCWSMLKPGLKAAESRKREGPVK